MADEFDELVKPLIEESESDIDFVVTEDGELFVPGKGFYFDLTRVQAIYPHPMTGLAIATAYDGVTLALPLTAERVVDAWHAHRLDHPDTLFDIDK